MKSGCLVRLVTQIYRTTLSPVQDWIAQAKELLRVVTY